MLITTTNIAINVTGNLEAKILALIVSTITGPAEAAPAAAAEPEQTPALESEPKPLRQPRATSRGMGKRQRVTHVTCRERAGIFTIEQAMKICGKDEKSLRNVLTPTGQVRGGGVGGFHFAPHRNGEQADSNEAKPRKREAGPINAYMVGAAAPIKPPREPEPHTHGLQRVGGNA